MEKAFINLFLMARFIDHKLLLALIALCLDIKAFDIIVLLV